MARYGFEDEKPERLAGIEATWDRGTLALLTSLGIGSGWRCPRPVRAAARPLLDVRPSRHAILRGGALTEPEFDETLRFLEDPHELVLTPVLYAAWGRKPAAS
jgi:hypothetical protein